MKTKILAALKTKYKNLGFGEKAFEGVAEYLATTVTEEADVETATGGVEPMLKAFQSEADRLRGENATLKTQLEKASSQPSPKEKEKGSGEGKDDGDDTPPKWANKLFEELNALKADKVTGSRKSQLDEKLEGVPDSLKNVIAKSFNKMKFDSDDEFAEYRRILHIQPALSQPNGMNPFPSW